MQIALNQLLMRANPHRLLIEPTGLGHPLEVLQTLSADYSRNVLSIQKTLTLVDARNLSDKRYRTHETFRQQLAIADVVVANKNDLSSDEDRRELQDFVKEVCRPDMRIIFTEHGQLSLDLLSGSTLTLAQPGKHDDQHDREAHPSLAGDLPLPESGYVTALNEGEGFESVGWRFSPDKVFDRAALFAFLSGLNVERMKAVFITRDGVFAYNMTRDALSETELDDCIDSRMEIIAVKINPDWVNGLTGCLEVEAETYSW